MLKVSDEESVYICITATYVLNWHGVIGGD